MTELVMVKGAVGVTGVATGALAVIAAVDPSVTSIVDVVIGGAVSVTLAFIAYKTVSLNKRMESAERERATQAIKLDQTLRKTEVIEGHVNSEKTKAAGEIMTLQKENQLLREVMADKKETAALLAQAVVTHPPAAGAAPTTLKAIEKNTEATANNTAKTDATVQEIKDKQ